MEQLLCASVLGSSFPFVFGAVAADAVCNQSAVLFYKCFKTLYNVILQLPFPVCIMFLRFIDVDGRGSRSL